MVNFINDILSAAICILFSLTCAWHFKSPLLLLLIHFISYSSRLRSLFSPPPYLLWQLLRLHGLLLLSLIVCCVMSCSKRFAAHSNGNFSVHSSCVPRLYAYNNALLVKVSLPVVCKCCILRIFSFFPSHLSPSVLVPYWSLPSFFFFLLTI